MTRARNANGSQSATLPPAFSVVPKYYRAINLALRNWANSGITALRRSALGGIEPKVNFCRFALNPADDLLFRRDPDEDGIIDAHDESRELLLLNIPHRLVARVNRVDIHMQ